MRLLGQKSQKYTENIAKFPAQWQQSTKINLIKKQNVFRKNLFIFVRLHHVWHLWGLHLRGKTQNQKGELQNGFLPLFPFPSHHPLLHTPSNSLHPYNSFSVHTHTDRLKKTKKSFFKNEIILLEQTFSYLDALRKLPVIDSVTFIQQDKKQRSSKASNI